MKTTIAGLLTALRTDVERLRERIGTEELNGLVQSGPPELRQYAGREWKDLKAQVQDEILRGHWMELVRIRLATTQLKYRVGNLGRPKGERTSLTDEQIAEIKAHFAKQPKQKGRRRRGASQLAKRFGVSRQTIYNVLDEE